MTVHEKKVVHEVSGWLRVFDDGSVDRTWFGPPEPKFMLDSVPPHDEFINGVSVHDVDLEKSPRVRVYMPETRAGDGPNEKLPIILHFHGGGYCISQPNWLLYYHVYSKLARLSRAIIVSVYLRLAPENRLPAAIDDGFSALLWLTSLARSEAHDPLLTNRADFERVFLLGDSSGANLVHQVGARGGDTNLSPLKLAGSILIHSGVYRSTRSRSELEMPQTPFLTLEMADKFVELALPIGWTKDRHPVTCPMGSTAPALSGLKLPPIMFCVADKDLFVDVEMEFYEALKNAGKTVELFVSNNMSHCFYLNKLEVDHEPETKVESQRLLDAINNFIKRHST